MGRPFHGWLDTLDGLDRMDTLDKWTGRVSHDLLPRDGLDGLDGFSRGTRYLSKASWKSPTK